MLPLKRVVVVALIAVASGSPRTALAQSVERLKDEPREGGESAERDREHEKDPIRGSTFVFEQSMSTQTAHLEPSPQQSNVPFYGWWLSLRPRWNFNSKLRVQARFDYYKEFTNSQDTTTRHEDVFDDTWLELVYTTPLARSGPWANTKVSLGARALLPTSKQSQAQGIYLAAGATAGIAQDVPINGENAKWLNSAYVSLRAAYVHPFSAATTPTNYGGFAHPRVDTELHAFQSDQISGQTLSAHKVYGLMEAGLQVTPKLSVGLDVIWIGLWHYAPTESRLVTGNQPADQQYTPLIWLVAAAEYSLFDELSLGLGYYNLGTTIAPDGKVRSPFAGGQENALWSPDARVFLSLTANLDKIFEDVAPRYKPKPPRLTGSR